MLHELDESAAVARDPTHAAEAAIWLERASIAIAQRQGDLELLAPWARTIEDPDVALPGPGPAPTLAALVSWCVQATAALDERADAPELRAAIDESRTYAEELIDRAIRLAELADDFVEETEFGFLFDRERQLFSIGFSVTDGRLDSSYYDTLASEARLASFVAIATGQIPHEHWFKLEHRRAPRQQRTRGAGRRQ